ncbi:MAG: hypothetical protein Q9207_000886 [Kuettlingeria erythrocarpa]
MPATDRNSPLLGPNSHLESVSPASQVDVSGLLVSPSPLVGQISFYVDSSSSVDGSHQQPNPKGSASMQGRKLRHFARRTREATKRLLNTSNRKGGSRAPPQGDTQSLQSLEDDPAFQVHKLNTEQRSDKGMAAKMKVNL